MLKPSLDSLADGGLILCLGAHCDDVEIGCGATLFDLTQRFPDVRVSIVTLCSDSLREAETRRSVSLLLGDSPNVSLNFAAFSDGYLPYQAAEVKNYLRRQAQELNPDIVITHSRADLHQDHRFVGELTYQLFRDNLILEMEIAKYDGDVGRPNVYFPVSELGSRKKVETLTQAYESQLTKHWFTEEIFLSLMRIRGLECRSESGFAEAYYASKLVLT